MRALTASTAAVRSASRASSAACSGGDVGHSPALPFGGGVELLEVNQVFKVWMQGVQRL